MSSLSLDQKWNSTTDYIDPWSITSQGVHHQPKQVQPHMDITMNQWSNDWSTNASIQNKKYHTGKNVTPKTKNLEAQTTFYQVAPGQSWDSFVQDPTKKLQKKIPSKQFSEDTTLTHQNWVDVNNSSGDWSSPQGSFVDKDIPVLSLSQTPSPKKISPPSIEEELGHQSRYKTELCRSWTETGNCRYGVKCQFAHGHEELRPVLRHPKYKTELCRSWTETGSCPYGKRCRFIHKEDEKNGDLEDDEVDESSLTAMMSEMSIYQPTQTPFEEPEVTPVVVELEKEVSPKKKSRLPFFQELCL